MANETTTTTMDDVTNASLVEPVIIMALSESPGIAIRSCREFNGIGKPTNALKIPIQTSYWGSPADRGAGVDGEWDATQGTALANTPVSTGGVTITAGEYGVAHALTDNVGEDSAIDGAELMSLFTGTMLKVLLLALDDDFIALFASLSNTVGSTGVDLTLAQGIAATHNIVVRGAIADAIEYVLDPEQVANVHAAVLSTNAAAAVYAPSADRLIGFAPSADRGAGPTRKVATLNGWPITLSGLTDTANAGADVVGAAFCPTTAQNDTTGATTFALMWKRLPRFETQRQAKGRSTDLVMTMRAALAELQDGSGTSIITDAP